MKLVLDPGYNKLATTLARDFETVKTSFKRFSDGELYFRVEDSVEDENVATLLSGYPNQDSAIVKATLLSSTLKDHGAKQVVTIFPYFPYARQDKRFLEGEPISAKYVAKTLYESGTDFLLTIDVHDAHAFNSFGNRFINLKTYSVWAEHLRTHVDQDFFLVSPDEGRATFVENLAKEINCEFISLSKQRNLQTGEVEGIEVKNRKKLERLEETCEAAVLSDDIISTGGTASEAMRKVKEIFKGHLIAAFTHGIFLPGAIANLLRVGAHTILTTDTIDTSFSDVSVAPLIANRLKKM